MSDDRFTGWRFDAKDDDRDRPLFVSSPRVLPDGRPTTVNAAAVVWGFAALGLLAVCEGTLAWVALRWAASLGWLAETPGWSPVVGIAVAVTYLRGIDRAVFRRPAEDE